MGERESITKQLQDLEFYESVAEIKDKLEQTEDINNLAQLANLYESLKAFKEAPEEQKTALLGELFDLITTGYIETMSYALELANISKELATYLDFWACVAQRLDERPDRAQAMTSLVDLTFNLLEDFGTVDSKERANVRATNAVLAQVKPVDVVEEPSGGG